MKKLSNYLNLNGTVYSLNLEEVKAIVKLLNIDINPEFNSESKPSTESDSKTIPSPESKSDSKPTRSKKSNTNPSTSSESKSDPKSESKTKEIRVVGSLEQCGKYVRTISGKFLSSKARYAIRMNAEAMGAKKVGKGHAVYEKCAKSDKYVQVYEFKNEADAIKFMDEQEKRLVK